MLLIVMTCLGSEGLNKASNIYIYKGGEMMRAGLPLATEGSSCAGIHPNPHRSRLAGELLQKYNAKHIL